MFSHQGGGRGIECSPACSWFDLRVFPVDYENSYNILGGKIYQGAQLLTYYSVRRVTHLSETVRVTMTLEAAVRLTYYAFTNASVLHIINVRRIL